MPSYDYKCNPCSIVREVKHGVNETPIVYCDNCGKPMEKMISAPQVTYKGDWFQPNGKY